MSRLKGPSFERLTGFFLAPARGSAASLLRVSYAIAALWLSIDLVQSAPRYFGPEGVLPWAVVADDPGQSVSLLALAPDSHLLPQALTVASLVAAVGLLLGVGSRFWAAALFVIHLSLQHRNPFIFNAGDRLFLILSLLASLLPLDARWSLSERWRRRHGVSRQSHPIGFQRLIALQVAYVYAAAFGAKIGQAAWRDGSAVTSILASPALSTVADLPALPLLGPALTWGTLLFELCFPVLVWSRAWRPYLLLCGVLFHLGIQLTMGVPHFALVMIASYPCFLSDDEAEGLVVRLTASVRMLNDVVARLFTRTDG